MNGTSINSVPCVHFVPYRPHEHAAAADDRGGFRSRFSRLAARLRRRFAAAGDRGMSTAEYAVGTVAACGFAAVLYKVVTGGAISSALTDLVTRALHAL